MKFPTGALASSAIPENSPLVRELIRMLRREIVLHRRHAELLKSEEAAIVKFKVEAVHDSTTEREVLVSEMEQLSTARTELMKQFPQYRGKRLSELVQASCHPKDIERLMPLIEEFKAAAVTLRADATSTGQLAQFALNLVNGSISIFKGASQNIVKSYTQRGRLIESLQPAHADCQGTLRQV